MTFFAISALLAATLFAGAALYISLVEHPARLVLDDRALLAQWQPSYKRALPIQAGLAIAGGIAGLIAGYGLGGWSWIAGGFLMLANWPFTLLIIMPVNKRLQAMRPDQADEECRQLLLRWGGLHNVRSALGAMAMLLYAAGLWTAMA
jgi:hypothetical protein